MWAFASSSGKEAGQWIRPIRCLRSVSATASRSGRRLAEISRFYDDVLQPTGLRVTQFLILAALAKVESASVNELAERLDLERTAMGKTLGPLDRDGLIRNRAFAERWSIPPRQPCSQGKARSSGRRSALAAGPAAPRRPERRRMDGCAALEPFGDDSRGDQRRFRRLTQRERPLLFRRERPRFLSTRAGIHPRRRRTTPRYRNLKRGNSLTTYGM